ncbi:MAG: hypothetical protein JWP13_424 [Candidatus Saccharibacteria bacterium]|nr:hypothetical protein [Candidatus Saccharibacteria bacterium]
MYYVLHYTLNERCRRRVASAPLSNVTATRPPRYSVPPLPAPTPPTGTVATCSTTDVLSISLSSTPRPGAGALVDMPRVCPPPWPPPIFSPGALTGCSAPQPAPLALVTLVLKLVWFKFEALPEDMLPLTSSLFFTVVSPESASCQVSLMKVMSVLLCTLVVQIFSWLIILREPRPESFMLSALATPLNRTRQLATPATDPAALNIDVFITPPL